MRISVLVLAALIAGCAAGAAEEASVKIEGKAISVKYSPGSVKGRKIFGGVVPYNQVWRIGETTAAAFHTDADLVFQGATVPKGDYSLYILADAAKWQLIISRQTGPGAATHNPKMDLGRIPMNIKTAPAPIETCTITITKTAALAARLEVAWETTVASVTFHLDKVAADTEW
jgi:hypothetical protein